MAVFLNIVITLLISWSAACATDTPPSTGTAALVNGAVISTADFRGELARILRLRTQSEQELDPAKLALTKKEALETLISRELLFQESQREGIKIQDAEVEAELSKLRSRFPREDDFTNSLGKLDLTREVITLQIKRGMAIQALIDSRFSARSAVTESEVRSYYDRHPDEYMQPLQIRLSHILVKSGTQVSGSGVVPARTKVEAIHRRILQGEDFALLARESDDTKSSTMGGDLGWFTPGRLEKNLESIAFSLEAGQVSTIVEDRFGYHILKATDHRPELLQPYDDIKEQISKQLQRQRLLAEVAKYLNRLRETARVEIHLAGEE